MTNAEARELLDNLIGMVEDNQENDYDTALIKGRNALILLDKIKEIIGIDKILLEQDVLRYKMICELVERY